MICRKNPFFIAVGLETHNIVQLLLLVSLFPCLFNNIHLMSDPEGNSKHGFVFSRVLMFPKTKSKWKQDSRENKSDWFPEGCDIKCFVIFIDFHFISNKRITKE